MMHHASSLGDTGNFQFIVRAIIPELQNNLTSKCNAHKLLFTFLPPFCVYIETSPRFEFFLRSKQLASGVIWRAIILIIKFPSRIVYDECAGACQC